jgi:hypothetical protein
VVFSYDEGTGAYVETPDLRQNAANEDCAFSARRATGRPLHLVVEGRGGRTSVVGVRTPRRVGMVEGVTVS